MLTPEAIIALVALLVMCAPAALVLYRRLTRATQRHLSNKHPVELYRLPDHGLYDVEDLSARFHPATQRQGWDRVVQQPFDSFDSHDMYTLRPPHTPAIMGLVKFEIHARQ